VWRAWIRRDRAALALVMMLSLAIFEPLLCIINCQFWMPTALRSSVSTEHQHHHMHLQAGDIASAPIHLYAHEVVLAQATVPAMGCTMHIGYPSGSPLPMQPSPLHETLLTFVLPLFIVLLAMIYVCPPLTGPPRVFVPVPLRPPISIAS
jgi:hypothetical protein